MRDCGMRSFEEDLGEREGICGDTRIEFFVSTSVVVRLAGNP
jgi:hypothetical protein